METNSQIASRGLTSARGKIANGGSGRADSGSNLGVSHAEFLDSFRPDCLHDTDLTVFRSLLSTALRNGNPLQYSAMETNLNTVGDRIRYARDHGPAGKVSRKDLAAAADIAYSTLADVENGNSASTAALHRVAKRLRVRVEWLETGRGAMEAPAEADSDADWPPVRGYAQAVGLGNGAEAAEYEETHKLKFRAESLHRKGLRPDKLAVVYGKGDSMLPRIQSGDAILFDTSDTNPVDGHLYVIAIEGAANMEYNVKRCEIIDEDVFFRADNPAGDHSWRKPRNMYNKRHPIKIIGRVRWIGSWEE